ncbi:YqkE family protein [Cohnella caldifontis]|uniref:YqkE family protein n=1 Tax=Cohnella caldifontis TaxID=3027471 RepID=UPI0023EB7890|nr:YqkE family protein [Cohnella sp. YIM B05605]
MSGNRKRAAGARPPQQAAPDGKPPTLKDLLDPDTAAKLKARAEALKAEEARSREEKRKQEEAARKAEQKRLENDFEYLLKNSKQDWRQFK